MGAAIVKLFRLRTAHSSQAQGEAMQRPPGPSILSSRSASEWINRVGQKHKQLAALEPSAEERDALDRWAATEFVYSTLALDGATVEREKVASLAARPTDLMGLDKDDLVIEALLEALRTIESLVESFGRTASLAPDVLIRLHNPLGGAEGFRKSEGDTGRPFKPTPPEQLPAAIETACRWFKTESFAELNPVEQASIAYLRLVEFQPFEESSDRTSLVAASLFTMRSGLPPVIIRPETGGEYRAAVDEGLRMNTKPMVELIAGAVERALGEMIRVVEGKRRK
jgi:Fic/DOC family